MIDGVGVNVFAVDEKGRYQHLNIMDYIKKPDYSHYYDMSMIDYRIDKAKGYEKVSFENER